MDSQVASQQLKMLVEKVDMNTEFVPSVKFVMPKLLDLFQRNLKNVVPLLTIEIMTGIITVVNSQKLIQQHKIQPLFPVINL